MTDNQVEAQALLDSREAVYGDRVTNMERVAKVFSGILGTEVRPDQVPLLMVGYKTVRASETPDYEDNVKDIEGYALMFREVIGDDMISAVNTDEYLWEKARREISPDDPPAEYCKGCGLTLPLDSKPFAHGKGCKVAEFNAHVRAYNSTIDADLAEPTPAQAVQLQIEVPSYQPGPVSTVAPLPHLKVYQAQLSAIFLRTWKGMSSTVPVATYADAAAREAVEFFWLTFQKNAQLTAQSRELG